MIHGQPIAIPAGFQQSSAMRAAAAFFFLLTIVLDAQTDLTKLLAEGMKGAIKTFEPVPAADKKAILTATATLLARHVTFRPDGTASSYQASGSSRRPVEWKRLVVRRITAQATNEADRLNGISKRYLVSLGCDAHRTWDSEGNRWNQWHAIGNPAFPSAFVFEWKGNAWTARESSQIKFFTPGPGPSIAAPKAPAAKRTGKDADLPPGMSRATQ